MKSVQKEEGIQINKYISNSGFCSRREAEKLIEHARVTINDEMVLLTARVFPGDVVAIDGEKIKNKQKPIYIALNKPVGVTSTTDDAVFFSHIQGERTWLFRVFTVRQGLMWSSSHPPRMMRSSSHTPRVKGLGCFPSSRCDNG